MDLIELVNQALNMISGQVHIFSGKKTMAENYFLSPGLVFVASLGGNDLKTRTWKPAQIIRNIQNISNSGNFHGRKECYDSRRANSPLNKTKSNGQTDDTTPK